MPKSSFCIDMPRPYYWEQLDNFFHKVTAMESPRKNNDCYFYYYSTCTKGDNCTFRHEPSALGCETMCSYWQQGKCLNQHCNFRHMELRKNRKAIPCYWETQPSGCRKPHCPFQHKNPREPVNVEPPPVPAEGTHEQKNERSDWNRRQAMDNNQHPGELSNNEIECARPTSRRISQTNTEPPTYGTPSVDPLVVNFEEESDNESTTNTPVKFNMSRTNVGVKTLEEIRLEKIQEASAALYFYGYKNALDNNHDEEPLTNNNTDQDLRQRLSKYKKDIEPNFEILSLSEIRKRKSDSRNIPKINVLEKVQNVLIQAKNELEKNSNNITPITTTTTTTVAEIKIKTLDEIRAERALKNINRFEERPPQNCVKRSLSTELNDSTCKRPKIQRKQSMLVSSACDSNITESNSNNNTSLNLVHMSVSSNQNDVEQNRLMDNGSRVNIDCDYLSVSKLTSQVPDLVFDAVVNNVESDSNKLDSFDDDFLMKDLTEEQKHINDSNDILQDIDQLLDETD